MARPTRRGGPVAGEHPVSTGVAELVPDPSGDGWTLLLDGVPSSHLDVGDPRRLDFEYVRWLGDLVDCLPPGPLRAAHLGGGACTLPRYVDAVRPGSRQVAFEVDERLVQLVRTSFALPRPPALRLRVLDGREGLSRLSDGSQDLVVRDAFSGPGDAAAVPEHLTTTAFVAEVARVLADGGTYAANVADRPPHPRARAEAAAALERFASVALVAEPGQWRGRRYGNVVLLASREPLPLAALERRLRGGAWPARVVSGTALQRLVAGAVPPRDRPEPRGLQGAAASRDRPPARPGG